MRSQVRNQLSSHKFPKSIKMKSDHHPLDDSRSIERVREKERERERPVVGEAIAVDPSAATADSRHRQPHPIGDRPATAPRSY